MTYIEWAAYDPIFWAHHAMIDREWRLWQRDHFDPIFSDPDFLGQVLPPFEVKVADVLNVRALGYEYASSSADVPGGRGG